MLHPQAIFETCQEILDSSTDKTPFELVLRGYIQGVVDEKEILRLEETIKNQTVKV